jgi:phage host-nuclease inhibitor protein Gam
MTTQQARTRNEKYSTPVHQEVDQFLAEFREADRKVEELEAYAAAALAEVQKEWADKILPAKYKRDALAAHIKDLEKEHQANFFGEVVPAPASYSIDLPHGTLIYDRAEYVVKPRKVNVLALLTKYGFEEAIRRTAAVDWEVLNDPQEWDDEALAIIGTRREVKETYGFQVKGES